MKTLKDIENRNSIIITRGIQETINNFKEYPLELNKCLSRHFSNDFGELEEEDINANLNGIKTDLKGDRVLSRYKTSQGDIYIITELYGLEGYDIITTILYPEEY